LRENLLVIKDVLLAENNLSKVEPEIIGGLWKYQEETE